VQAAADAAALSAAADLFAHYATNQGTDPQGTAQASALANAAANGFSNDGAQSIVTVNTSPNNYQGGPNAGKPLPAGYVEVIIQYNAGRTFSNIFGAGDVPIRARAVARGTWAALNDDAVIALNLNAASTLAITGRGDLNILGGLQVNSNSSSAIVLSSKGRLIASQYNLVGSAAGIVGSLLNQGGTSPIINYGSPVPDPLRYLPDPDPVQLGLPLQGTNLQIRGSRVVNLYPGVYSGGITVSNRATVILHANADGTPGIYYMQGSRGFNISGSANVMTALNETAGIMIYNDWQNSTDTITLASTGLLSLTPPSSGMYKGVAIFQKRGTLATPAPVLTIAAATGANLTGTIYAAYANVHLSGQSSLNIAGGQIIADTLMVSGNATVNIDPGLKPVACARSIGLVE
jgi:hypothetical protein